MNSTTLSMVDVIGLRLYPWKMSSMDSSRCNGLIIMKYQDVLSTCSPLLERELTLVVLLACTVLKLGRSHKYMLEYH